MESILPMKYVAFVGGGGKTSLIEYLATGLIRVGKTVVITTTTKIYAREPYHVMDNHCPPAALHMPFVRIGKTLEDGKLTAVNSEDILSFGSLYDVVLIEADGAKSKPLKVPASYEPVIPSVAEKVYVVGGLDALHQKVRDVVFRWQLFHDLAGIDGDKEITPDIFISFFSESILFKGVDKQKCCVILNKYDTLRQISCGCGIARSLCGSIDWLTVIVSSVSLRTFYEISH